MCIGESYARWCCLVGANFEDDDFGNFHELGNGYAETFSGRLSFAGVMIGK